MAKATRVFAFIIWSLQSKTRFASSPIRLFAAGNLQLSDRAGFVNNKNYGGIFLQGAPAQR